MARGQAAEVEDERVSRIEALTPPRARTEALASPGERIRWLVETHFDFIWRSLRRLGLSPADAQDGAQEVFTVASQRLDDIHSGRERAFLFGTALRVASSHRRRARHRYEQLDGAAEDHGDAAPSPETLAERRQARVVLDQLLEELTLQQRTVFVLYELEEMTVPDIATLLDVPVGTVASRLRRARAAFADAVERLRASGTFRGDRHD